MLFGSPAGSSLKLPYRVLVLDDDEHALSGIVELLRDAKFLVTAATNYEAARRLLAMGSYDLLVSDVRLRGFNGINLIRQCAAEHGEMALVIITGYDEPTIEFEAGRYGAKFVKKPIQPTEFLNTINDALSKVRRQRRWTRKRVVQGFRVTAHGHPAAVVDVCYGGLRLEVANVDELPSSFDVEVGGIGLHFEVDCVWASHSSDGSIVCGAALATDATPAARTWRAIVDRLSA